jgi:drug/metabolite transporter (DMT)-like permease
VTATGWAWLACLAVVSTVGAISLFFAGLRRVGPSAASILSTIEPVVTVALAFVVFGESLGPAQLVGGALVLSAVVAVRAPLRVPVPEPARTSRPRRRAQVTPTAS